MGMESTNATTQVIEKETTDIAEAKRFRAAMRVLGASVEVFITGCWKDSAGDLAFISECRPATLGRLTVVATVDGAETKLTREDGSIWVRGTID
jgi:hypothetical protein